jgi:hypothetical protein
MTDPERLLHSGSAEQRALLRAAREVRPRAKTRDRLLAGLGLAGLSSLLGSSASAGTLSAASKFSAAVAKVFTVKAGIVVGATALASGAMVVGVTEYAQPDVPSPAATTTASISPRPRPRPSAIPVPQTSASAVALPPLALPSAQTAPPAKPSAKAEDGERSEIADELALLDGARTDLARGQPASALQKLTSYRRRYPNGTMSGEAQVLRIQALRASGERERAAAEARSFIAAHPNTLLANRLRRWLEEDAQR